MNDSSLYGRKLKNNIIFVGKGYSSFLNNEDVDREKLEENGLPQIYNSHALADFLELDYKELQFISYHREIIETDHYIRYKIPKRSGGERSIAAPKPILKRAQRNILDLILSKVEIADVAHGFLKNKSIITNAKNHSSLPKLIINIDIKDFFPSITFERIRGMYKSLGYSGYIASILAIICTFCERMAIEVDEKTRFVATTKRILPQGSPASPMITNIICRRMDSRLEGLSKKFSFTYTRYADDMSFSTQEENKDELARFYGLIQKIIKEEGFEINRLKTRFLRRNNQQNVTGLVVNNESLGIPRKWIRQLRAAIHNARKDIENGKDVPINTICEIEGMVSWVKSINYRRYIKIIEQGTILINKLKKMKGIQKPIEDDIERLELFRRATQRSRKIPFSVAKTNLQFSSTDELIKWLWTIDIGGFTVDYENEMIIIPESSEVMFKEIDKLLSQYDRWGKRDKHHTVDKSKRDKSS